MTHAIRYDHYGDPDVLHLESVEVSQPKPDQVLIEVRAAGVNPLDAKLRTGSFAQFMPVTFPHVPGLEVAGRVLAVGSQRDDVRVGEDVFGWAVGGGYAEQALARDVAAKPAAMPWEVAAAIPVSAETALRVLNLTSVSDGDVVLVHGASGAVGAVTAQFARARGAHVIGTASGANQEYVRSLGAEPVVYGAGWADRVRALARPVQVVIDTAGAGVLAESVELAGGPDRVVTIADNAAAEFGVRFTGGGEGGDPLAALALAIELWQDDRLAVAVAATFPLAQAADAHRALLSSRAPGKLVLLP